MSTSTASTANTTTTRSGPRWSSWACPSPRTTAARAGPAGNPPATTCSITSATSPTARRPRAKALFFGGVTRRFPNLRVALLEGGADWGSHVYTHLVDRWESATARRCRTTTRPTPTSRCCRICSRATARISSVAANRTRRSCCATAWASLPCRTAASRTGRAGRFRRRRHRVGRGHPQALGGQLLLRLRGRRPHRGGRLQRPRPSAGREDQRDLVLRHRPLGRARPDRAAGRKLGPGRTGRHQRAGLQGPGVRQSLPPLHRGQSRFLPGHGDRAQARRPPAATDTKTRAA